MFNFGLVGAAYALMHATHGIADYWIQTDWQAQNKSKNLEALSRHIFTYSAAFIPMAWFLCSLGQISTVKAFMLPAVIGLPHMWMDRRRFLTWFCERTKGWTADQIPALAPVQAAVRVHVSIHMDQKFHYLCLLLTALWLGHSG